MSRRGLDDDGVDEEYEALLDAARDTRMSSARRAKVAAALGAAIAVPTPAAGSGLGARLSASWKIWGVSIFVAGLVVFALNVALPRGAPTRGAQPDTVRTDAVPTDAVRTDAVRTDAVRTDAVRSTTAPSESLATVPDVSVSDPPEHDTESAQRASEAPLPTPARRRARSANPLPPTAPAPVESTPTQAVPELSPVDEPRPERAESQVELRIAPQEIDLIRRAIAVLRTDPAAAIEVLDDHARRFPEGELAQDREALAIESLARLGADPDARARATLFFTRWPDSPLRGRIVRALLRGSAERPEVER